MSRFPNSKVRLQPIPILIHNRHYFELCLFKQAKYTENSAFVSF